jgi:hypothetical protein
MKAVFLIYRLGYYRFLAPLIDEGLRRGLEVECWHDYSQPKTGKKGYSFPDIKDIPSFKGENQPKIRIFYGDRELENLLLEHKGIDVVFSIHMSYRRLEKAAVSKFPFRWATIMTGADSLFEFKEVLRENPKPNSKEIFFVHSRDWLNRAKEYLNRFYPGHRDFLDGEMRCEIVGNPEFDAFSKADREITQQKYGIPKEKPVLLYLPFPYDNRSQNSAWERAFCGMYVNTAVTKDGVYLHGKKKGLIKNTVQKAYCLYQIAKDRATWKYWIKGLNEKKVFTAVRRFCDRNNLFLVVKPRLKFPVAEIVNDKSDLMIWDDEKQQDPPALKELLMTAKLTVSFFSSSVFTSVAAGVPHLNVTLPENFFMHERHRFLFTEEAPSEFNFEGVCKSWTVEEMIAKFDKSNISDFAIGRDKYNDYVKKYLGFNDHGASKRIFDFIL